MKAKNFFSVIVILLLACTAGFSTEKQERNVAAFSKIKVSSIFNVYLSQGAAQSVTIEADESILEYIETSVSNETLNIKLLSNNNKHWRNRDIGNVNVYITATSIDAITASGASRILTETPITHSGNVSLNLSGAANMTNATITCKKLTIDQSGAAKSKVLVKSDNVEVDISGAASLTLTGETEILDVDGSGAAAVNVRSLSYNKSNIDMSGAASVKK